MNNSVYNFDLPTNIPEINDAIKDVYKHVVEKTEMLAAAYIKETDISPEDAVLVTQYKPDRVLIYFAKKSDVL